MTGIKCKIGQPNVRLEGKKTKVGDDVVVSKDTIDSFPLSFIPIADLEAPAAEKKAETKKAK